MEKFESIKEIAIALSKFQGEYAPLSEVINTTRQGLSKYGLSIVQSPYTKGENIIVEIFLLHFLSALLNISSEEFQPTKLQEELITEKQMKYIHILAKEKAIDNTSLKNYSKSLFSKESSKDLTKKEASTLIEAMQIIGAEQPVTNI